MDVVEYEKLAATENSMWWFKGLHGLVLDRIVNMKLRDGAQLVNAGCGTGGMLLKLAHHFPRLHLRGVDVNPEAVRLAQARAGVSIAIGSVDKMPCENASADAIISLDVLCHAGLSVDGSFAEFARCLKPGAPLLLSLPAYQWMMSGHDTAVSTVRRFSRSGLRRMLIAAGFEIEADGYWNSLLFPLMLVHRFLTRSSAKSDVRPFSPWQERLFGAAIALEAAMRRSGLGLPFGGSVWVVARRPARN